MRKVVKNDQAEVRHVAENKRAYNFITKEDAPNVSLAVIEAEEFDDMIEIEQDFIYYVLEGELRLSFDDEEIELEQGDSCFVSAGEEYRMSGTFRSVVVSQPAFGT